ncbi:MAG: hypothetical protein Q8R34_01595, partial [bacterium]|nr:hypothetical protein [bacterium]
EIALINDTIQTPTPSPTTISENDPRIIELKKSLPRFEDYPAKVYSIPPKPIVNHESNPYGMLYWTVTEEMASASQKWAHTPRIQYDMAGHYLMDRYATGNPHVLIIDGLTGQVFHEYGSLSPVSTASSSLVMFNPIELDYFSPEGDYEPYYGENPRYAVWNGKQFITICKPIIKNWKLISCGVGGSVD